MELPIKPNSNLSYSVQRFFKPFIQTQRRKDERIIMPLLQVEKLLHTHYVNLQPIDITFEYYDNNQEINQQTITANITSTVQQDRRIAVKVLASDRSYLLSLEQILTVSANAA